MSRVQINMLGNLEIVGTAGKPMTRKVKAVAAYLALQRGQPVSRQKIATMFWQDSPLEQARTNLRQCLAAMRKQFGDTLIADTETVMLDPDGFESDAARFERLAQQDGLAALKAAAQVYKGDLLDGFGFKEDAFESWLRPERERYHSLAVEAFARLLDASQQDADASATIRLATRLLSLDPLNEAVHRRLMQCYAAQGRFDAALKQFETCRNVLARELDVRPQPETVALLARLKAQRSAQRRDPRTAPDYLAREVETLGIDTSLPDKPSIVILPIEDLSTGRQLGYIAEGIRIDIQSALVKLSGLFVIAAGSAGIYAGRNVPPQQVARELSVRHILQGSVRGDGRNLRIAARLTDGLSRRVIWSERFDRVLDDTFIVPDEIIERIVTSLDVRLVGGEQARVWRKTLRDPKALELYYRGLDLLISFNRHSVAGAREIFMRVAELAPDVTLGPTCVAFCFYWDVTMGWSMDEAGDTAKAASWAERAAAMDDADGQAHAILAHVRLLQGDHDAALDIAEQAVAIRPMCANTNALSANVLVYCGQPHKAVDRVKAAIRLAPVYAAWWLEILATAYLDAGQADLAVAAAGQLLAKSPASKNGYIILIAALIARSDIEAARGHAERLRTEHPGFTLGHYARQQPYQDRRKLVGRLDDLSSAGLTD